MATVEPDNAAQAEDKPKDSVDRGTQPYFVSSLRVVRKESDVFGLEEKVIVSCSLRVDSKPEDC